MFYTNVYLDGNKVLVRGYKTGMRYTEVVKYKPYLFLPKDTGKYRTVDGVSCDKIEFGSVWDAREFINQYKDVDNFKYYGLNLFEYVYINDKFKGDIDYDPKLIKVGNIDLECMSDVGFPSIDEADKEITAITIRCSGKSYVFGCGYFRTDDESIRYFHCKDEMDLLVTFLDIYQQLDIDVLTGWNIEYFDIPYLINRLKRLFGDSLYLQLSPWKKIKERRSFSHGKTQNTYDISGISILDYLALYRKLSFGNDESYSLDYISAKVTGKGKLDYSEYGSLAELYKNNYQKFIEYNIIDVLRVEQIDDKMKFLEQVYAFAYDAKVNYNDMYITVKPWDVIIHNHLLAKNIVIPQYKRKASRDLAGGFVKEPQIGLHKWVVSFDLKSSYPNQIVQYNISPETMVGKIKLPSIDRLADPKTFVNWLELDTEDERNNYAIAANGCLFRKNKQGFIPELMDKMLKDRAKFKKLMIEAKKKFEKTPTDELNKLVARYHNMQLAKKIQLNSLYGSLANQYSRWFDIDLAEAITLSGQLAVRWVANKMNKFLNNMLATQNVDYIIASDTDSIYINLGPVVEQLDTTDELKIVDTLDKMCQQMIQPKMDVWFKELADYMQTYENRMVMNRENICNKGIWRGAKMYILNVWNGEGDIQYKEPQLLIHGIEAVRSSTPKVCRDKIWECMSIIMNKDNDQLIKFVQNFREEFNKLPYESVAFPRSMNGINEYSDKHTIFKSGTPIHVRGALLFNNLLSKYNIKTIQTIHDGDKIRFSYLKMPNPIHQNVIAVRDTLPKEFGLDDYIDRDLQFEKSFLGAIQSITNIIGWDTEKRNTLESFFV